MKMILWIGRRMTSEGRWGRERFLKKKMAEDGKSMRAEKYQNSWSKVKRMWSLITCSCGRKQERKSLQERLRETKEGRGAQDRKLFVREAAVHLSQHRQKKREREEKKENPTGSPTFVLLPRVAIGCCRRGGSRTNCANCFPLLSDPPTLTNSTAK